MLDRSEERELLDGYRAIQVIFFAILGSLAMYLVVGLVLAGSVRPVGDGFPVETMVFALSVMGAGLTLAAWAIRKFMLNRGLGQPNDTEPGTVVSLGQAIQTYRNAIIVVAAMAECIGIFGLVLLILGARQSIFFTFLGLSAMVMWLMGPRFSELKTLAETGRTTQ